MNKHRPWSDNGSLATRRSLDLLTMTPLITILLLVGFLSVLLWLIRADQQEKTAAKLATDALWVEQTLRFQLASDEDFLRRLTLDPGTPQQIEARVKFYLANNPEVLSFTWYDAQQKLIMAWPASANLSPDNLDVLNRLTPASATRPVYSPVRLQPQDKTAVIYLTMRNDHGLLIATLSLDLLLARHLPWWITESYTVSLLENDLPLIVKGRATDPAQVGHRISFYPPLSDVVLQIYPHTDGKSFISSLLLGALAGLALLTLVALIAFYRSTKRWRLAELDLLGEMAFRHSMEKSLTVGLRAKDQEGKILYVNQAFCVLTGYPAEKLLGQVPPMPYWCRDHVVETELRQQRLVAEAPRAQSFETSFCRPDGSKIDVHVYEAPLIDARGQHHGWMGSVIDVTEARRAERLAHEQTESLARASRLVTLGEMASSLAHEINQPLAAIASYAAGARNMIMAGNNAPDVLEPVMVHLAAQANRAGEIVRRIKTLVNKHEPLFTSQSLDQLVIDTISFLRADARNHGIGLEADLGRTPPVMADRLLLEQLLINLIRNALEAMSRAPNSGTQITLVTSLQVGNMVRLSVVDQGPGIAPEIADHLFDAFATTKPDGMGIGLNICRTIVELHKGSLSLKPCPDGGTIFDVTLPMVQHS